MRTIATLVMVLIMTVAVAQTPKTTIGAIEITGSTVMVPVTTTDITGIGAISLTIKLNPSVLSYQSFTSRVPGLLVNGTAVPGTIKIAWFGSPLNLPAGDLCVLKFGYIIGATELRFIDNGASCEWANAQAQALPDTPFADYYANGYAFPVVTIAGKVWMQTNLNVGDMIQTTAIQTNNNIPEKYCYNNLESNCTLLGGFYRWDEMMQYVATEGTKGICPTGWHLPTKNDFITLAEHTKKNSTETSWVGGSEFYNRSAIDLKAVHPGWKIGVTRNGVFIPTKDSKGYDISATNATGFSAIPSGHVGKAGNSLNGPGGSSYYPYGWVSQFWSSTKIQGKDFYSWASSDVSYWPVYWQIQAFNNGLAPSIGYPETALSVRCLKD